VTALKVRLWRALRGVLQWYILWLAHAKFVIGVSGVILNERNQVLLLRHRYWQEGSWGLPGGYANAGEKLEEALAREVREETGYAVNVLSLLRVTSGYRLHVEVSYAGRLAGGEFKLDPGEVLEARFFSASELPAGLLDADRELVRLVCGQESQDAAR
jgi:8-oxo-dGTP diphosphatase